MRIVVALFLFFPIFGFGQINFLKLYTDDGDDYGYGVVQLEDSSYVITGASSSFSSSSEAFLLHVDSLGNYLWSNHYGGSESEEGRRVMYVPGDGFYVAGTTNSIGAGVYDFYLFKTDLSGNLLWENSYGGYGWERLYDAALLVDGIIMVGENSSNSTNNKNIYLVKSDFNGDTLWTKTLGGTGNDIGYSLEVIGDSIFIAGEIYSIDSSATYGFLACYNGLGNELSFDTIYCDGSCSIRSTCKNGNILQLVGSIDSGLGNGLDYYHLQKDLSINSFAAQPEITSSLNDWYSCLCSFYDGNSKLFVSFHYEEATVGLGDFAFGVRQHELSGAALAGASPFSLSFPGPDLGNEMITTSDGGVIIVGSTNSIYTSYNHVFLVKIGLGVPYPNSSPPHDENQLVGFSNDLENNDIVVFPNPTKDFLNIDLQPEDVLKITSLTGHTLKVFQQGDLISLHDLPNGTYIAILDQGVSSKSTRIVKY